MENATTAVAFVVDRLDLLRCFLDGSESIAKHGKFRTLKDPSRTCSGYCQNDRQQCDHEFSHATIVTGAGAAVYQCPLICAFRTLEGVCVRRSSEKNYPLTATACNGAGKPWVRIFPV